MDTSATVSDAVGDGDEPPEPTGSTPIEITITLDEGVGDVDASWLCDQATAAAAYLAATSVSIDVRVVADATMAALHAQHAGVDGTTDVLTFDRGSDATSIDADIAVCIDEAARAAKGRGHGVLEELLLYVIHGALHCVGFDDCSEEASAAMHAEEDRILLEIGVGELYGGGAA